VVRLTECDREAPMISRPWPTRVCCAMEGKIDLERNIDCCNCAKFKVDSYMYGDVIRRIGLISLCCVSILVDFR
jgi:hypothetical protein